MDHTPVAPPGHPSRHRRRRSRRRAEHSADRTVVGVLGGAGVHHLAPKGKDPS
ncbi:hypothetical protein [Nesterenkonia sp. CL21]|uniref:hypothetical protein n=1 Tax=unclassified Nesterenkonia TaxID=2629769 RepID=UPI0028792C54|nr:hypothetical protein [Nesterenkonia sp. CL21]MDS2173313.1 hypothetical protein [Nesterenkonia sp. CL21]